MRILNDPAPWWGLLPATPLTIVDLIGNRSISPEAAALAWWVVDRGASAFVAAQPRNAGKTTLATSLLSFLPDGARLYVTAGPEDQIQPPTGDGPLYLLVNELSGHMPLYLHGPAARRAFGQLGAGARMIGTLHAGSADEAVDVMRLEAGIPDDDVAHIDLYLVIQAWHIGGETVRRVSEIALREPLSAGSPLRIVASWAAEADLVELTPGAPDVLAAWANAPPHDVERGIARRADALLSLLRTDGATLEDVTETVRLVRRDEGLSGAAG